MQNAFKVTDIDPNAVAEVTEIIDGTPRKVQVKLNSYLNQGTREQKLLLGGIKSGDIKILAVDGKTVLDPSVITKFRNAVVPTISKNEAVDNRIKESTQAVADKSFVEGIKIYPVRSATNTQTKQVPIEVDKETHNKLVHSQLTGDKSGDTYVDNSGMWVIKGKQYNPNLGGVKEKLFKQGTLWNDPNSIDKEFDKSLDATGVKDKQIVYGKDMGNVTTVKGKEETNKMFNSLSNTIVQNSNAITYKDPEDPYNENNKELSRNAALAKATGLAEGSFTVEPVSTKDGGVMYSNVPVNNEQLASQKFVVIDKDGVKHNVDLKVSLDNKVISNAQNSLSSQKPYRLNKALSNLKNGPNVVTLKDSSGNPVAYLNNTNNMVKYNNGKENVSVTLEKFLETNEDLILLQDQLNK